MRRSPISVTIAFPSSLDEAPGAWRYHHPATLASYCDNQFITSERTPKRTLRSENVLCGS